LAHLPNEKSDAKSFSKNTFQCTFCVSRQTHSNALSQHSLSTHKRTQRLAAKVASRFTTFAICLSVCLSVCLFVCFTVSIILYVCLSALCIINFLMSIIRTVCHEIYAQCLSHFQFEYIKRFSCCCYWSCCCYCAYK